METNTETSPLYEKMKRSAEPTAESEELQEWWVPPTAEPQGLQEWWVAKAEAEITDMLKKTGEYGGQGRALDLIGIGEDLAHAAGRRNIGDAEATELGIWFYIRGKIGRAMAAIADDRLPSDDTIHDILVYARMLQRTREFGGWPN